MKKEPNQHPAIKPIKVLSKHIGLITYYASNHNGLIEVNAENYQQVVSLEHVNLGYFLLGGQVFKLSSTVMRLIQHYEQRTRFANSNGEIAGLVHAIKVALELYHFASDKSQSDSEMLYRDLEEKVHLLSGCLRESYVHFSGNIHDQLLLIDRLEVRILANENALEELKNINDTLSGLSVDKLIELGTSEPMLEALLFTYLKPEVDKCQNELVDAAHRLRENLLNWKKDLELQKISRLINRFARHYHLNPDFVPDPKWAVINQRLFHKVPVRPEYSHSDLYDPETLSAYQKIAKNALKKRVESTDSKENKDKRNTDAPINESNGVIEEKYSVVENAIIYFFEALQCSDGIISLTGRDGYIKLKLENECNFEDWLSMIVDFFNENRHGFFIPLALEFNESIAEIYNGNRTVHDVTVFRSA